MKFSLNAYLNKNLAIIPAPDDETKWKCLQPFSFANLAELTI